MTANATIASILYVYKHMYDKGVGDEALRLHPTVDDIAKLGGFGGDQINYAVKVNNAQNITSGALSVAQAVGTASKGYQFQMKRCLKRGTISLDVEALLAAEAGPDGAFETLVVNETDGFVSEFNDRLGFDLFRDSTGVRGQIASISGNVLTLTQPDDARNFKLQMPVAAGTAINGSAQRTGTSPIAAVDTDGGTITLVSVAAITSLSVNDYLFASPEVGSNIEGFALCTPLIAPVVGGGDSFRTVDRSAYPSLLCGARVNDTNTPPEENAGKVAVKIRQNGGTADRLILNPQRYWEMCRRLGAKIIYSRGGGGTAEYGFERVIISSPAGDLEVISDADCPTTRGYVADSASHRIRTLKEFIHIANEDGNYNLRMPSDDAIETRVRSMSNYQQLKPRNFGVFAM